jgi:hypothetical protein
MSLENISYAFAAGRDVLNLAIPIVLAERGDSNPRYKF